MASDYADLALVSEMRGDRVWAERMCEQSPALFKEIGAEDRVKVASSLLDELRRLPKKPAVP